MNMTLIGGALFAVAAVMFFLGVPHHDQQSRITSRWGLAVAYPYLVMCLGLAGFALVLRGLLP
jgi:hypothetical protein